MSSARSARAGVGAVELLVALILVAAVVHGAWRVFAGQRRATAELRVRTELLDTDRAVRTILGDELGAGVAGRDWWVPAPGVVELRAFRGWGAACPGGGAGSEALPAGALVVAYRGLRLPDPDKDSVLALRAGGTWTSAALAYRAAWDDGCPGTEAAPAPGAVLERWTLDPAVPDVVLLRVFERGSYHLADGSLRYRRGASGRQPLTPPALDPERSGVRWGPGDTTATLSVWGAGGRGGGWVRILHGNGGGPW